MHDGDGGTGGRVGFHSLGTEAGAAAVLRAAVRASSARATGEILTRALVEPPITHASLRIEVAEGELRSEYGAERRDAEPLELPLGLERGTLTVEATGPLSADVHARLEALALDVGVLIRRHLDHERTARDQDRFRWLADHAPDVVYRYEVRPEPRFTYLSPSVEAQTGYAPAEFDRQPELWLTIVHPEDQAKLTAMVSGGSAPDEPVELRWIRKDGRTVWTEQRIVPEIDNGVLVAVGGVARDVTERRTIEDELRASEAALRGIVRNLVGAVYVCEFDAHWTMRFLSDQIEEITGYSTSDFIDNERRSYESVVHPSDREPIRTEIQRAISEDRAFDLEYRIVRADGEIRWISERGHAVQGSGNELRLEGLIFDATESRVERERLRRLSAAVEQSPISVLITDKRGRIEYVNPRFVQVTGYALEEIVGGNPRMLKSGYTTHEEYAQLWSAISSGKVWRGEFRNRRKDGTVFWERAVISPIFDGDEIIAYVGSKEDVTLQRELEQQLMQSQKMEAVGRLAGGIAHDFNNMLTAITGYADFVLEQVPVDAPVREDVEQIRLAAERSTELTSRLLAFGRQQLLRPVRMDLNELIASLAGVLRRMLGEDIHVELDLEPELPAIRADRTSIEQVLLNLLINAKDAMPSGGRVEIRTRRVGGSEPGRVRLSVTDEGSGMDEATQDRIFEPFFTTKEAGKGTGLGLSTVYGIVQQSGGSIRVDSDVERGTRFDIELPSAAPQAEPDVQSAPSGEPVVSTRSAARVLVVEDEWSIRRICTRTLSKAGYRVIAMSDPKEAIAWAGTASGELDVLLSDVVLPGMSGPAMLDVIRSHYPDVKAAFMSGYAAGSVSGLPDGARFLPKPFTRAELLATVDAMTTE